MAAQKNKVVVQAVGGRPAKISRGMVLDEARLLGAHELTFARIAERLGVRQQSLYYHFASRDELLHALAVELAREFEVRPGNAKTWKPWLEETALRFYDLLVANPAVLDSSNWRGLATFGMPIMEAALETLENAGFGIEEAGETWDMVGALVYAHARLLTDARKISPLPARPDPDTLAGQPVPRTRAYYAKAGKNPRKKLEAMLHRLMAALSRPRPSR